MLPPTVPDNAKIAGNRSQTILTDPRTRTAIINTGTNQSTLSLPRARSKPLTESFIPTQLSCIQGKKKHIKIKPARLNVPRRINVSRSPLSNVFNVNDNDRKGIRLELVDFDQHSSIAGKPNSRAIVLL